MYWLITPKYYKSISELPVKAWFDIHKTGNYNLLLKNKRRLTKKQIVKLSQAWESLVNEWITTFGFSDEYNIELEAKVELANMQADYVINNDRSLLTLIAIEEEKIKMNNKEVKEPADLNSILAKMSKHYGFKLSARDLTTEEYYAYLNSITDG